MSTSGSFPTERPLWSDTHSWSYCWGYTSSCGNDSSSTCRNSSTDSPSGETQFLTKGTTEACVRACVRVLDVYNLSRSFTPLRTVDSSQAAAGLVLALLFLFLARLATFLLSAWVSCFLLAAPSYRLASSVPRSCARWAINSLPRPGPLLQGLLSAGVRSVARCAPSRMLQSE